MFNPSAQMRIRPSTDSTRTSTSLLSPDIITGEEVSKVLGNTLTLSTFAYVDVSDGGIFNRFSADYAVSDQVHALIGYDYFHADKGMFLLYAHNSEAWMKLKYSF